MRGLLCYRYGGRVMSAPAFAPGARVSFRAMRGAEPVAVLGTVLSSSFNRWALVHVDNGPRVSVRLENLRGTTS